MTKYVGIVGSRKRNTKNDRERVDTYIRHFIREHDGKITIVTGGAKGIDTIAEQLAKKHGLKVIVFLPKWEEYKTKFNDIYFERNKLIAEKSDILVVFPLNNSGGSMNTVKHFKAKKGFSSMNLYTENTGRR